MLLPALLLVRRSPESVGLAPDDAQGRDNAADAAASVADDFSMREAMRTRAFWFLLLAGSSFSLIGTALTFHNVSLLTGKGLDAGTAAGVLSVMAASSIGANLASGYLNDRFPNRFILAAAQCVLVGAMLFTFMVSSAWLALVYGAVLGAGMGLGMNTNTVIWPNYFGRRNLGSIRGMAMTSTMAFAALGPLPFSVLYDLSDSYDLALLVFLALPAACATLALLSPRPVKRAARRPIGSG